MVDPHLPAKIGQKLPDLLVRSPKLSTTGAKFLNMLKKVKNKKALLLTLGGYLTYRVGKNRGEAKATRELQAANQANQFYGGNPYA